MTQDISEQYIAGMMRALEIMRAHDKYPDHYLSGIAAIEREIREKVEERWRK